MQTLLTLIKKPDSSEDFMKYSMSFAREMNLNVHLLYVENPIHYPLGVPDLTGAAVAQLQNNLKGKINTGIHTLSDQVTAMMPMIAGKLVVEVSGKIGDEEKIINEMVQSGEAQMVMIESSGKDGFWLKDSSVQEIVRNINCPVWIIPEDTEFQSFNDIIYATDYQEEDIPTLIKLIDLTHLFTPHITALHITDNADFDLRIKNAGFQKMLETKTEYIKITAKALVENTGDDMVSLIHSYADRTGANLIVVLKENRRFLERIFKPSSSEKIIEVSSRPVLVYHI
ncbi:MAG: universal stress protein [Bacteroidota bacterium]|nr:universal stress protein [Bacteroidota bacterium]